MLEVLRFADKDVRRKLFERAGEAKGLLMVTATRHGPFMRPVAEREPFATLERELGDVLTQVVCADEGTVEGMWRDPVGDLADALIPDDGQRAFVASSGYLLLRDGKVADVVKRHASPRDDAWFIQEALARLDPRVPAPSPSRRPGPKRARPAARPEPTEEEAAFADEPTPPPRRPAELDAWARLGIARGTPLPEARKAFHALIAQYHPDKVAHLAPEFRELADERTRQILAAWEEVQRELG